MAGVETNADVVRVMCPDASPSGSWPVLHLAEWSQSVARLKEEHAKADLIEAYDELWDARRIADGVCIFLGPRFIMASERAVLVLQYYYYYLRPVARASKGSGVSEPRVLTVGALRPRHGGCRALRLPGGSAVGGAFGFRRHSGSFALQEERESFGGRVWGKVHVEDQAQRKNGEIEPRVEI